jgi:hypothetical protein
MATKGVPAVIERIQLVEAKMSNLEKDFRNIKSESKPLLENKPLFEKMITLAATLAIGCLVGLVVGTRLTSG